MRLNQIVLTFTAACLSLSHAASPYQNRQVEATVPPAALAATRTKTKIWSTVESSVDIVLWIDPRRVTMYTTKTVTSFEPRPVFTSYPGTVVQVVVSHVRREDRMTYSGGGSSTSTTAWVATVPETWVVSKPTGRPVLRGGVPRCEESDSGGDGTCEVTKGNKRCDAAGLKTGCQGQCVRHEEEGEWWCYMMRQRDYVRPEMRMGRACWGDGLRYRQVNEPCEEGDLPMGCVACRGVDVSWGAVNWEGPEAGE